MKPATLALLLSVLSSIAPGTNSHKFIASSNFIDKSTVHNGKRDFDESNDNLLSMASKSHATGSFSPARVVGETLAEDSGSTNGEDVANAMADSLTNTLFLMGSGDWQGAKQQGINLAMDLGLMALGMAGPFSGLAATVLGGVLGQLLPSGPSESEILYKMIMKQVQLMISKAFVVERLKSSQSHLAALTEELAWVPSLSTAHKDLATSYLLTLHGDMATMRYDIFVDCPEDDAEEPSQTCKDWQEAGTSMLGIEFAMTHLSVFADIVNLDPSLRSVFQQRVYVLVYRYNTLVRKGFTAFQKHRLDKIEGIKYNQDWSAYSSSCACSYVGWDGFQNAGIPPPEGWRSMKKAGYVCPPGAFGLKYHVVKILCAKADKDFKAWHSTYKGEVSEKLKAQETLINKVFPGKLVSQAKAVVVPPEKATSVAERSILSSFHAPAPIYLFGETRSARCPEGTLKVRHEAACKEAAEILGKSFGGRVSWSTRLRGCFHYKGKVWLNSHILGSAGDPRQACLCKVRGTIVLPVLSNDHASRKTGLYFNFNWIPALGHRKQLDVYGRQCRGAATVWEGKFRLFRAVNGGSSGNSHGRRFVHNPSQFVVGDFFTNGHCPSATPGCYFTQTASSNKCAQSRDWTFDSYGKDHYGSHKSASTCFGRKTGHDAYCGTPTSAWTFVGEPLKPGCYFMQKAGSSKCPPKDWRLDTYGKDKYRSDKSESICLRRKTGHDAYCGSPSSIWTFVHGPFAPGCYFMQKAGSSKCPPKYWRLDTYGKDNYHSDKSEKICLSRKAGHDAYCGSSGSAWMFIPKFLA